MYNPQHLSVDLIKMLNISISKFKKIDSESISLEPLNIFIGANNAGKSSFIQGIQFAISSCQTLELEKVSWTKNGVRTLSLDSSDFLYTPTRDIEYLYHGKKLTGSKTRDKRNEMEFSFDDGVDKAVLKISKGKNGGFTTTLDGPMLGKKISNIKNPYCVYVPGIAGIPTQEKFEVPIVVRKSATRGDSNNYLRNILLEISKDAEKWKSFLHSVNSVYDGIIIKTDFDQDTSEYIDVFVEKDELSLPLDAVGTGLLQVIQIFAYIEYFSPKVILLDEPDSHIHPTKQKMLAKELEKKTLENVNLKIVFSTHSRYILDTLDGKANVIHFQSGNTFEKIHNSNILLDIGAADADYLFSKKDLKFVIATEDKVDDIDGKKAFLSKFLVANGLGENEFVLHSYDGCTKVDFAKILEGFVQKHIPTARVILHIDRDQKIDDDRDILKLKDDCEKRGIILFVTKYQEMESYFCQPAHVSECLGIGLAEAKNFIEEFVAELEDETNRKLTNFLLRDRIDLCRNKNGQTDIAVVQKKVREWYEQYSHEFTPGKELLGKFKALAQRLKKSPDDLLRVSNGLRNEEFLNILKNI
jgi:predicted ATPase